MIERALVVGLGSIGQRHARVLRGIVPGVEITALRHQPSDTPPPAGIDHSVTSFADAMARRPQVAVIAGPAPHHMEVASRLAGEGIDLLIEKPLAANTEGVRGLLEDCRSRGLVVMVGYNLRFLPSARALKEAVERRQVGRVMSVRAEAGQFLPSWRPDADYRHTVSAKSSLGGGVLLELSHELDYLQWLFGSATWVSAFLRRQSSLEIDVEDVAKLTLGFPGDGGKEILASVDLDFVRQDATRTCVVVGEDGTLRWTPSAGSVELFARGAREWQTIFSAVAERDASYREEWIHFLDCVKTRRTPSISGDDGLLVLRVVEAARESSRSEGKAMRITGHAAE